MNDRKTDRTINGNNYRVGFDRLEWSKMNERTLDELFKYNRKLSGMLENQIILKNGTTEKKMSLQRKIDKQENNLIRKSNKEITWNGGIRK